MDWGAVAVIITANWISTAVALVAGLWFVKTRLQVEPVEVGSRSEPAPMLPVEPPVAEVTETARPRRRSRKAARHVAPREETRSDSRKSGLREHLASLGGAPGSISSDQQAAIKDLLGRAAPTRWMSSVQANALLAARDYAEAVVDSRLGRRADFAGRVKIVRRLTLTIVADAKARNFVIDWADGRYAGDDDMAPADPLEEDVWAWVQHHAARLMEAEGYYVEAA